MQRKERETVQKEIIREIAEGLYNGENFEEAQSRGNFERKLFIDQVSERLKEKLHADHCDRDYGSRGLNLSLKRNLKKILGKSPTEDSIQIEYFIKSNKRPRNDPIIDYDSDVSSAGDTMDQSTLDTSLMDSMNDSQVSTRSTSCMVEKLEAKINALEAKSNAWEARAKAAEAECRIWKEKSRDLFKVRYRPTRANGSGKCEGFDTRLDAIVLEAENRGVAAKHVHDVCQSFVDVLGWFTEDDPEYRIVFIKFLSGVSTREMT